MKPARVRVLGALHMLAAIAFDNQAPVAANEVNVVSIDRVLADKIEAAQFRARMRVHIAILLA